MRKFLLPLLVLFGQSLSAHCQIPCGIYHDAMVVQGLREDVQTLEKSVNEILNNEGQSAQDKNQLVRWVMNKEKHADKLADTLVEYFLKQRIKEDDPEIEKKAVLGHSILAKTMKVKQTVDKDNVSALKEDVEAFIKAMYPEGLEHKHE